MGVGNRQAGHGQAGPGGAECMYVCMMMYVYMCLYLYMFVTGKLHRDKLDKDKLDTGKLDLEELSVCMYDDVCVHVPTCTCLCLGGRSPGGIR